MTISFDDEFASPADYARIYRSFGMQIVPAFLPEEAKQWKRPNVGEWKQYTSELTTIERFEKWYGPGGMYASRQNMGIITGVGPRRIVVIDLDTHANPKAQEWWDGIHGEHNYGIMTETVAQKTGGGGFQYFFLCPEGWICPTNKNPTMGVDSRGQNGFAVLPPSKHASGNHYKWMDGLAPWETDIAVMPEWMCREVEAILGIGASQTEAGDRTRTSTPEYKVDPLGAVLDGREDLMTRVVFRAVLEMYRDSPIFPTEEEQAKAKRKAFESYDDAVDSRIREPGTPKHILLEREGRGISLFNQKWLAAMRQWDGKVSKEAARPFVKDSPESVNPFAEPPPEPGSKEPPNEPPEDPPEEEPREPPEEDPDFETKKKKLLKLYTMSEVRALGPVKALIQDTVAESSLGFIYGAPGCGKTFVALSMGLSIAYGLPHWFWGKKIERSGPVIYISLEGKSDLSNRLEAWKKHHKLDHDEDRFRIVMDEVNFLDNESIKMFVDSIDDYVSGHEKPVMIFIDTLSRAIAGGNENDQQEVSKFIQTCDRIKTRYSSNVTGIHHLGRSGEHMRGSTTLDGGADYMYRVTRDKENGLNGVIFAAKIKAYADKWELPFRLAKIDLDDFGVQSSLVAMTDPESISTPGQPPEEDFGGKQEMAKEPDMDTCKKMVEAIDEAWRGGYPWSRASGKDSDRIASERLADRFNFSVEVCQKYVSMWHRNDVIVTDTWGDRRQKKGLRRGKGL